MVCYGIFWSGQLHFAWKKSAGCELMKGLTALLSLTNLVVLPGKLSD